MFDPVSNPFAIQNLLDRNAPPFIGQQDEQPDTAFGIDPLAGGSIIQAFEIDRGLQLPEDDFAVDTEFSADFVGEDSVEEYGFEADDQPDIYAAFTGGDDAAEEVEAAAETDAYDDVQTEVAAATASETPAVTADLAGDSIGVQEAAQTIAETAHADAVAETTTELDAEPATNTAAEIDVDGGETEYPAVAEPVADATLEAGSVPQPQPLSEQVPASEPEMVHSPEAALSNEAVLQQIEAARAEAYAQALETGRNEGRDAERPLARQQGYDEGFAAGVAQAKAESQTEAQKRQEQEHQTKLDRLQSVIDNLQQLAYNPDAMFEPMKKLAIYLAEQLVRGELVQSPQAISRLIDNALRELNASGDKAVIIHLHPEDLEAYRPTVASFGDSLILRPDSTLERGSVRVSLDGSVVEDLMQRRIEGVKKSLAQAPAPGWRAGGNSLASRVQQGQVVDDVTIVDQNSGKDKSLESTTPADGHA